MKSQQSRYSDYHHRQHHLSIDDTQPTTQIQYLKPPKWLKYYKPSVTVNSTQYHFVSQPDPSQHQKVSLKTSQRSLPISMYYQVQNINQQIALMNKLAYDQSPIKDLSYLNFVQRQQNIILDKQQTIKSSLWAREYEPKAFYQLLTDQAHNRNVLSWLKSWDKIVFNKQVTPIYNPPSKFLGFNNSNNNNNSSNNNNNNNSFGNNNNNFNNRNANNSNFNNSNNNFNRNNNSGFNNNNNYSSNKPHYYGNNPNQYNHTKLLLLSGPPGCGKTTLARVIARHCGYEVAEINASDDRSSKALIMKIQALGKSNSITNNKPTLIIIDEVDGALEQDGNGIKEVLTYIQNGGKKQSQKHGKHQPHPPRPQDLPRTEAVHHQKHSLIPRPIIFICNDPFVKGLKQLRSKAIVVYFRQADKQRVVKRLKQVTQKQKVYIQNQVLTKIAQISNCDIRGSMSILQYIVNSKRSHNQNPKDLITKLKLSFSKDSNTSILQTVSSFLNQTKISAIKQMVNLKQFSYMISKIDNPQLFLETFFHNFILYKNFFVRRPKEAIKLYDYLGWVDILMNQSFRYNNQLDGFMMMVFLYYKTTVINDQVRKVEFPSVFFERLNKQKQNKAIAQDFVSKWPTFTRSIVSLNTSIKQYFYLLYYAVQTSSPKDSDIMDCVAKMITYGIQLAPRNAFHLFKPQFDTLLTFGGKKLQINLSNISRTLIQQSYQFAKLKSHLLGELSLMDINSNNKSATQQLLSQLNIKNKRRKRNPESGNSKNTVKYKFIEGSGTQITYDLKFKFFFE